MDKLELFKNAANLVVSIGAGAVVGNAIKISTPTNAKLISKVSIGIGGFVLSSMVGDMAAKYTAQNIDDGVKEFRKVKDAVNITTMK